MAEVCMYNGDAFFLEGSLQEKRQKLKSLSADRYCWELRVYRAELTTAAQNCGYETGLAWLESWLHHILDVFTLEKLLNLSLPQVSCL